MTAQLLEDNSKSSSWLVDILFLSLFVGLLFFIFAGTRPLLVPDEGRYAEIAREMVLSGDYITPYLNGIKYFEKPILFYWLESGAIKLFGQSIWSLRSVNILCGLLGCLLTYFTARQLYDRATGILAALILGTSMLYFAMSHMISLDLPVTVFLAACLYFFMLALQHPVGNVRRNYIWLAATASAIAVLTKGLIGIVFPGMIILPWLAITGEWKLLKNLYIPSALCIFALIAVPWHIIVNHRNPEFFNFYFITQHILRYTDKDVGHYQPVWFFIPSLFVGFFPWITFLPQTIKNSLPKKWSARKFYSKEIFMLLWAGIIFTFFSFSKSKLIPYILPMFPPIAILTAHYLRQHINNRSNKISFTIMLITAIGFAYVLYDFPKHADIPDPIAAQHTLLLSALFLLSGFITSFILIYRKSIHALAVAIVTISLFLVTTLYAIPFVDTRNIYSLAEILQQRIKPEDSVITFNQYNQDLPFYLKRRVSILNWRNELTFGMQYQDTHEWMIDNKQFMDTWHSPKRVYAIMRIPEFEAFKRYHPSQELTVLGATVSNVLVTNRSS